MSPRRTLSRSMGKKGSRRQTAGLLRGRRGTGRRLKLASSLKNGRRDFKERANNCRRMRSSKGHEIGTLENGDRVAVVSGESEKSRVAPLHDKSRVAPLRDISRRGVKIQMDIVLVALRGERIKLLGPEREAAAGVGGGASAAGAREGKGAGAGKGSSIGSIIYNFVVVVVVTLAGRESQCQVDNNGENNRADDANGWLLGVDGYRRKRSGGEGIDGDDDGCLSDWLGFYFEGGFHERSQRRRGRW